MALPNIMNARSKKALDDIYRKHHVEIRMSKEYSQQLIYMFAVYGANKWITYFIDDIRVRRKTEEVIYWLFTNNGSPFTSESVVGDSRMSINKFADNLCEVFPKHQQLIYCLLTGKEALDTEVREFLKRKNYMHTTNISLLYECISSGQGTEVEVLEYAKLLVLGIGRAGGYTFPCRLIGRYMRVLSGIPQFETIRCSCFCYSILICLIREKFSIKVAQYIPGSFLKEQMYRLDLDYLIYSIDKGYFDVNELAEFTSLSCIRYTSTYDKREYIIEQLIDRGLCFTPVIGKSLSYEVTYRPHLFYYWLHKRPQDLIMMIGAGLRVTMELMPFIRKCVDIPLFGIEKNVVHELTFMTSITRIEEYLSSKKICTNGLILATMYKDSKYYFGVIPADIVRIIHGFLR